MTTFSHKVGIVVPDISNQFFSELTTHVQRYVNSANGVGIILSSDGRQDLEMQHIGFLSDTDVDGIIFISVGDNLDVYTKLLRVKTPHVVLDREVPDTPQCDFVLSDNWEGACIAADYLLQNGHKRIGYIAGHQGTEPGRARKEAFTKRLEEGGLPIRREDLFLGDFSFKSGLDAGRLLVSRSDRPTAIACGNDFMAVGLMQALAEAGIGVPSEISVIGYDDTPLCSWIVPKLTTIRQETEEMARYAVDLLATRIRRKALDIGQTNPAAPTLKAVSPRLVVRDSCKSK